MGHAERRGDYWRARWRGPDGTRESEPGFKTKTDAENYARDQEAAIRNNTYVDPRAGRITLTEWVNIWFPALDLELDTLDNYRYFIEVHILPKFGHRELGSLTTEEIATWEKELKLSRRTAREARSTLINLLNDAIPRYIQTNPAARRRGKGRRGQRRIAQAEKAEKVWASPLQALLLAERCAALSGDDTDFVMIVTTAYTGARWSEIIGLRPDCVHQDTLALHWKLYELNGRFYQGRPKDGSIRTVDLPPFLGRLLARQLQATRHRRHCSCRNPERPWCPGADYVYLNPQRGHFRRSNYSARVVRPAADGWYPARAGRIPDPPKPVLVDASQPWPGRPVPPWPPAEPEEPYTPPTGRGVRRVTSGHGKGRCPHCGRTQPLRRDGDLIAHKTIDGRCPGSGQPPAEDMPVASWLPLTPGLTPHGLRHGHQTWMDDANIKYVLQSERMGHEVPGMRGTYGHVADAMRADLVAVLQELWETSLRERVHLSRRSLVPTLDALLGEFRDA